MTDDDDELPRGERFTVTGPDPATGARYVSLTKHRGVAIRTTVVVGGSRSIIIDLDDNEDVIGIEIL